MMVARRVTALVLAGVSGVAVAVGCSSGGSGGGAGATDPASECREFFSLSQDCYARAGQEFKANAAACDDTSRLDERTLGQIECALQSREAYCNTIIAVYSRDASAISPTDPEVVKLNACTAAKSTVPPCRDAVMALADCGVAYNFAPDCTGPSAAMAKCITDNTKGACDLYARRDSSSAEAKTFQTCQIEAAKVPQPEPDAGAEDDAF